jgi:DNA invertase Pin-like site-specific DNA recombinase
VRSQGKGDASASSVPRLGRKAVGYCRVSTEGQADRGVSLDAQAEKIKAMAVLQDAELIDIIVDGAHSGHDERRFRAS